MFATMNGHHSWYWAVYFMVYVLVQTLLLTNLLVGIVLDSTNGFSIEDEQSLQKGVLFGDKLVEYGELLLANPQSDGGSATGRSVFGAVGDATGDPAGGGGLRSSVSDAHHLHGNRGHTGERLRAQSLLIRPEMFASAERMLATAHPTNSRATAVEAGSNDAPPAPNAATAPRPLLPFLSRAHIDTGAVPQQGQTRATTPPGRVSRARAQEVKATAGAAHATRRTDYVIHSADV